MTVKEMHAGDGYAYLLRGVSDTTGMTGATSQMTRYYATDGNPPGTWMGSGLAGLDAGRGLAAGSTVSSDQMERLYRDGADPVSGVTLGRRNRVTVPLEERIAARVEALGSRLGEDERAAAVAEIESEERGRRVPKSVSGFDFTFTAPKSVSTLWAIADSGVREQLYQAHRAALADVIDYFERDIARTRIGTNGVARVETRGVIAAAFDHWDSRNGDPHLHTHVVIANRVQAGDGGWRTLDSLGSVFPNVVALSELYNNFLASQVTARLGLEWYQKPSPRMKAATWEVRGVPRRLMEVFSSRRAEIQQAREQLDKDYRDSHHRQAGTAAERSLDRIAWQTTRQAKTITPLRDLLATWHQQAVDVLGEHPSTWASVLTLAAARNRDARGVGLLRADDLAVGDDLDQLAQSALAELAGSRSTWTTPNIRAAVSRATMHVRLASAADIITTVHAATERVQALCVDLTPQAPLHTPERYVLSDGTSAFRRSRVFTTQGLLDAEARLLSDANRVDGPTLDLDAVERYVSAPSDDGTLLADDQAAAATQVAVSGRVVDVLVGPAGTGKTTTLAKLTAAWQATHGDGSVIGLAPSAAAAHVLGDSLGIDTDNTAKWLHEQRHQGDRLELVERYRAQGRQDLADELAREHQRWCMQPGSLVIVDEASLAGTLALDALREQAATAGAKLLLVGDPYQLGAVDAGGAFGLLVSDRDGTAPELTGVWRFHNEWERSASIQLRLGHESVLDTYAAHDRIHPHTLDAVESAYQAWRADERDGRTSLLIAGNNATVSQLNQRARADLVASGRVAEEGALLHDGSTAGRGDRIVTRQNERSLSTGRGWVKNGDTWQVVDAHADGSLLVQRATGGTVITLPAAYVADHVELGYATTAHRAQGSTVDTAHLVVDGDSTTLSREVLYVAMTRGRDANHAHVFTGASDDPDAAHLAHDPRDARAVLADALSRRSNSLSATQTTDLEAKAHTSLARLVAEYDTIRRWATTDRYAAMLRDVLPDVEPTYLPEWPQLLDSLRRLEAGGGSPEDALQQVVGANDPQAVTGRLAAAAASRPVPERRMILGVTPADVTTRDVDLRQALDERESAIRARAHELLAEALADGAPWVHRLPDRPGDTEGLRAWVDHAASIAARRELEGRPAGLGHPAEAPAAVASSGPDRGV